MKIKIKGIKLIQNLKDKFIALNAYTRKEEMISNNGEQGFHFKNKKE